MFPHNIRFFGEGGIERLVINDSGDTRPGQDNTNRLGTGTTRWTEIFAVNDTINTSDEREKYIEDIPDSWLNAAANIHQIRYKWLDGGKRWHIGYGAQSVYQALLDANVEDPLQISFLCRDVLMDEDSNRVPLIDEKTGQPVDRWSLRIGELNTLKMAYIERQLNKLSNPD